MRIIAKSSLRKFWEQAGHADAQGPLESWYDEATQANWASPQEIKAQYRNASICGNHRLVFNIAGNKYRLVVKIAYKTGKVFVRFVGTHAEYNKIDAKTI